MKRVVIAATLAACATGPGTQLPAEQSSVQAVPMQPASAPPPMTSDGRYIVPAKKPLWCFEDTRAIYDGGCNETQMDCQRALNRTRENDWAHEVDALQKSGIDFERAKKVAADAMIKNWPSCTEAMNATCFRFTAIVQGIDAKMCAPTIRACEKDREETARDPDFRVIDSRCWIYRVQ